MTSSLVQEPAPLARLAWERDYVVPSDDDIRRFARNINDANPVHHDVVAAKEKGLEGIIAPGVMTLGFISAAIAAELPGIVLCRLDVTFKAPLYARSRPIVRCMITSRRNRVVSADVEVYNGLVVIAGGTCTLLLPK